MWSKWLGCPCLPVSYLWKLDSYPPTENRRQGLYIPCWLYFKRLTPTSFTLRKTFLDYQRFAFQKGREGIYNCRFPNANAPRKERSRAWGQEEACPTFNQAEGKFKAILVTEYRLGNAVFLKTHRSSSAFQIFLEWSCIQIVFPHFPSYVSLYVSE